MVMNFRQNNQPLYPIVFSVRSKKTFSAEKYQLIQSTEQAICRDTTLVELLCAGRIRIRRTSEEIYLSRCIRVGLSSRDISDLFDLRRTFEIFENSRMGDW